MSYRYVRSEFTLIRDDLSKELISLLCRRTFARDEHLFGFLMTLEVDERFGRL